MVVNNAFMKNASYLESWIPEVVQVGQMPMPLLFFPLFRPDPRGVDLCWIRMWSFSMWRSGGRVLWRMGRLVIPEEIISQNERMLGWKGTISTRTVVLQTLLFRGSGLVMGGVLCHHNLSWEQLMYTVPELRQFRVRSSILMRDTCTPEGSLKLTNPPKDWHTQSWWFEKWESRVTYQIIIVIQPVGKLIIKLK